MFGVPRINMKRQEALYEPLAESDEGHEDIYARWLVRKAAVSRQWLLLAAGSLVLNVVMAAVIVSTWIKSGPSNSPFPQALYCTQNDQHDSVAKADESSAPAQHLLEYKTVKFHGGFNADTTEYMDPPSPELDQRWEALYNRTSCV